MKNLNRKQSMSILKQIQRFIAIEALSPTVIELYFERKPPHYKIYGYTTTIPNEFCMDIHEKYDHLLDFPNATIEKLSKQTTHYLAKDFILNQQFNDFILN